MILKQIPANAKYGGYLETKRKKLGHILTGMGEGVKANGKK
jgi:hypothetical protein